MLGNVDIARVNVIELRGFEKFCLGRPVEDLPRITPRICGVCPWSHHLASAKACDAVFGVEPPPAGKKLRELCNSIAYHGRAHPALLFPGGGRFPAGAGCALLGPQCHRRAYKLLPTSPDRWSRCATCAPRCWKSWRARQSIPRRRFPADSASRWLPAERDQLRKQADEALELAKFSIAFAKENVFPKYLDVVKSLGVITTGFIGTVKEDGALNLYDGKLRLMTPNGSYPGLPVRSLHGLHLPSTLSRGAT